MLLIYKRSQTLSYLSLSILGIETGQIIYNFNHPLHRSKHIDFIEQFNEKLLIKQANEDLRIINVRCLDYLHDF